MFEEKAFMTGSFAPSANGQRLIGIGTHESQSFFASDRAYEIRRILRDILELSHPCGPLTAGRLTRAQTLRENPRRSVKSLDPGERLLWTIDINLLDL